MNRRIGVVATLVLSALAFTGGAMLYSGAADGEPTKKVVAGPVDSLIRPHSPIIGPKMPRSRSSNSSTRRARPAAPSIRR